MLAYAKGEAAAFDLLYAKHKAAVYRFFIRQNLSTAVAEELSHDAWLKLINNRENYQATALFNTFLFTIVRRIAIDYSQKKSVLCEQQSVNGNEANNEEHNETNNENQHDGKQSPLLTQKSGSSQLNATANQSLAAALKQQIAALPYDQREVFLLKQEAGFSIEEIAKITFQNKEKVKSCWRYALQKLRKGLSLYGNE